MMLLDYAQRLFSLDTLDTRFTSAKTPPDAAADLDSVRPRSTVPNGIPRSPAHGDAGQPSLWRTPEFYSYYLIVGVCIPLMFKAAIEVSQASHPEYPKYEHLLSPGWLLGRKVDNSDAQYSGFRDNLPYMFLVVAIHPMLRRAFDMFYAASRTSTSITPPAGNQSRNADAEARLDQRATFDVGFALIYLCALHGFSAVKVLLILYANYNLATKLPRAYVPAATWIGNIALLFANELCHGYSYSSIETAIVPWSAADAKSTWGAFMDSYGGLIPRWEILFNITVLRLISFNMDHYWSQGKGASSLEVRKHCFFELADGPKKKQLDPAHLSEKERVVIPASLADGSFRNYLGYVLYPPLYLTGPILTFNDYISQSRYTPTSITLGRTLLYGVRFLISLLAMELILHFIYVVAISKAQPAWEVYTPFQVSMLGYFNLHIIWLKLLLPWRFFRLWSLLDGIDPPENMIRCMSNNYSAAGFWRAWHRSYYRWTTRYIYIPLGGSGARGAHGPAARVRAIANMLAVFTFVALWHDINLRLLMWGWLVTLFVLPEILGGLAFPARRWQTHPDAYRWICGAGAVGNHLMMMAANLVGFAIGLDGLKGLVMGIVGSYAGLLFLASACTALFVGAQIMFEIRQSELRQGIKMNC